LERQKEGIEIAKREGKYRGRKAQNLDNFEEVYQSWINNEITAVAAAKLLGVTRATFYKRAKTAAKTASNLTI
jgi:DNA invertase Pin-like site-specific DNA recombinase